MPVEIGQTAPDFELPAAGFQETVSLSSFRGDKNVVVLFFPLAWTGVCTQEMCSIRDSYDRYTDLDAEVLGISVDSPFALQAWAKEQGYEFPLLSDFNRDATRKFGVLMESLQGLEGVAERASFVVDRDGVVRYAEVCPSPGDLPDLDAIRECLASIS